MRCKNKVLLGLAFGILLLCMFSFVSSEVGENLTANNVTVCVRQKSCDNTLNGNTIINT